MTTTLVYNDDSEEEFEDVSEIEFDRIHDKAIISFSSENQPQPQERTLSSIKRVKPPLPPPI